MSEKPHVLQILRFSLDFLCKSWHEPIGVRGGLILIVSVFSDVLYFGRETGSRRGGRGFKRSLEAVGFILAEFELKRSHGDPIRGKNYGFGTHDMCCVGAAHFVKFLITLHCKSTCQ